MLWEPPIRAMPNWAIHIASDILLAHSVVISSLTTINASTTIILYLIAYAGDQNPFYTFIFVKKSTVRKLTHGIFISEVIL
jgi:hypothetical protein